MLCRWVLRPTNRAGIQREDEETLVRWQDSTGAYNTLHESELQWELSTTPKLLPILRDLPESLLRAEGSWQYELRKQAGKLTVPYTQVLPSSEDNDFHDVRKLEPIVPREVGEAAEPSTSYLALETAGGRSVEIGVAGPHVVPAMSAASFQAPNASPTDNSTTLEREQHPDTIDNSFDMDSNGLGDDKVHANDDTVSYEAAVQSGASLTFLGTGAAMPSKYRNVSSMLLQVHPAMRVLVRVERPRSYR